MTTGTVLQPNGKSWSHRMPNLAYSIGNHCWLRQVLQSWHITGHNCQTPKIVKQIREFCRLELFAIVYNKQSFQLILGIMGFLSNSWAFSYSKYQHRSELKQPRQHGTPNAANKIDKLTSTALTSGWQENILYRVNQTENDRLHCIALQTQKFSTYK